MSCAKSLGLGFFVVFLLAFSAVCSAIVEHHTDFAPAPPSPPEEHKDAHSFYDPYDNDVTVSKIYNYLHDLLGSDPTKADELKQAFAPHPMRLLDNLFSGKTEEEKPGVPADLPKFGDFEVDPNCYDKSKWYFRTIDGSCNWLKKNEYFVGSAGQPFGRDRAPHFKPGTFDVPREGPNPRDVSNAFFQNNRTSYWAHTTWLTGFVEFIVHDLMFSPTGREPGDRIDIPVPKCDSFFDPNCTGTQQMPFWRTKRVPGTGETSPRENVNDATIWIDLSPVYGHSKEVNDQLRTFVDGKLKTNGTYLPLADPNHSHMKSFRGHSEDVFLSGDVRANQDFLLVTYQTLFVHEHNRLCDILKSQHPDWDDERLFLTARVALSAKFSCIAAAYFLSYFNIKVSNPGLYIWSTWFGEPTWKFLSFVNYPYRRFLNPETNAPFPVPSEFSLGYRWHDLIPSTIPLVDERGNTYSTVNLVETAWKASEFMKVGLEDVIRGMSKSSIPDFRSGMQDSLRNIKWDLKDSMHGGGNFDLAAWAIEGERERGLPTFNEYMRHYQGKVPFSPRKTFEEFTSNPVFLERLKKLYKHPDEVDLAVGQELDETFYPGTHIPTSMMIINFYTLSIAAAQDRFALQYNLFHCLTGGNKPWNCKTTNALQDLLFKPIDRLTPLFPNAKWFNTFWWKEFDILDSGTNLLRRLVVDNTNIRCLQKNLFFEADPVTNPIICEP